jgi:hypothetical protein
MNELVIRPKFKIGDKVWNKSMYYSEDDEMITIEDITIDEESNSFRYHYSFNRWFCDREVGKRIFRTTEDLKNFYLHEFDRKDD